MRYFNNVNTLEELRKQYKELLKKYHPDNPNGSTEATKEINVEYDTLFKTLKDRHEHNASNTTDNKTDYNNMKYDFSEDEKLREVLQHIVTRKNYLWMIYGTITEVQKYRQKQQRD